MQRNTSGNGPLKVTDPAAFARLMADMKLKAQQQEEAERKREAERAAREGSSYKTKEERTRQARQAKEDYAAGEETRSLESRFDPQKNYYSLLDVDRAASSASGTPLACPKSCPIFRIHRGPVSQGKTTDLQCECHLEIC